MAYPEQTLGALHASTREAQAFLIVEAPITFNSCLDIRDALIMQAASHVLLRADVFFEPQILELTGFTHSLVSDRLKRYIDSEIVFEKERVGGPGRRGRPRRSFAATEFGAQVFGFFQNTPTHA